MAGASIALGLLGLFTAGIGALVGLILGIVSLGQIDRSGGSLRGRGTAIGGIVVSGIVLLLMFFMVPIIAAILFPVFAQAREKARQTVCITNMRHVGTALLMYAQDYDEHLPPSKTWCDAALPYVRVPQGRSPQSVFSCPSLPNQPGGQAFNRWLGGAALNRIAYPGATVEAFDAVGGWDRAGGPNVAVPRHSRGLNVLFIDGRVRWTQTFQSTVWKPSAASAGAARRAAARHRRRRHR